MLSQYELELRIIELESFNWRKERVPKVPKEKIPKGNSEKEVLIAKLKKEGKL